jgi:hypothetical protein
LQLILPSSIDQIGGLTRYDKNLFYALKQASLAHHGGFDMGINLALFGMSMQH